MCGIVGYLGKQKVCPFLISGLKKLEYRGYDSAGIALIEDGNLKIRKRKGKVSALESLISDEHCESYIGIGHTRWATHGAPDDINAHPHISNSGELALIHNGILENYRVLKQNLEQKGYFFQSETDTEVFVNFIEDIKKKEIVPFEEALRIALSKVVGAYAIAIISKDDPHKLVAARRGSPLVIGIGKGEFFLSSDPIPIIEHTNEVIYLKDEEIAVIEKGECRITDAVNKLQVPYIQTLEIQLDSIEKGGYEHFMLKEIFEQPKSISDCMRGRLNVEVGEVTMGGINNYATALVQAEKITIVACGTSWHAGLVTEYLIEDLCRIPVEVEYASEFRYKNPVIKERDIVMAISQSGETADTLAAMELAKSRGAILFGIVNVVGSSISRMSHQGAYLHAGPEIGVASTKAFTAQLTLLYMIALWIANLKGTITGNKYRELLIDLSHIPEKMEKVLKVSSKVKQIAEIFKSTRNFLYLGRGYNFPVALEGALKLKEVSYIHAEGYPAAEMKHGPIALIDENMPLVVIATADRNYNKIVSNIQEIKARKGIVIAIVTEGDTIISEMSDFIIEIPATHESLIPLIAVVPLQLLSYYSAIIRGTNVDQPRNLAKSVTVE